MLVCTPWLRTDWTWSFPEDFGPASIKGARRLSIEYNHHLQIFNMMLLVAISLLAGIASAQLTTIDTQTLDSPTFGKQPRNYQVNKVRPYEPLQQDGCWGAAAGLRSRNPLPREYLQSHQRFTSNLLKHQGFWGNIHHSGVSSSNSFTLGHFLAVLSQEVFDLPTSSIPRILSLNSADNAVDSYSQQYYNFEEEDNHVFPTSYLFTPYDNLQVTPGIERLFTRKWIAQLYKNQNAPKNINELVRVATQRYIEDELVPQVPPFHEQTAGVFTTTFHFANDWKYEWNKIGKQHFYTPNGPIPIDNYEFQGAFPVSETQSYTAVAIPLEGGVKHAVFVMPVGDLKDYFGQGVVDEIFTGGLESWPKKNVRVQVPHVNFTVAHGFSQLQEERLECTVEGGLKPHILQPIVQVVTFSLNHEELVYSVATGAQVNQGGHNAALRRPFQASPLTQRKPIPTHPIVPSNPHHVRYTSAELVFDRPFFVYLHDRSQGPFGFTALSHSFHEGHVEAQRQVRHHDSPFDFQESTKAHRWNCQQ